MGLEQNRKYLRNMLGAIIDFIIIEIDEDFNMTIASRIKDKNINLRIDDLDYRYIQDVNDFYFVGYKIKVKILVIDKEKYILKISVKALLEDPYKNIRIYITEGGEYIGTITGYAPNGIYIKLKQGIDGLAIIPIWMNKVPKINSRVSVRIHSIDEKNRKIYCSILRVIRNSKIEDRI